MMQARVIKRTNPEWCQPGNQPRNDQSHQGPNKNAQDGRAPLLLIAIFAKPKIPVRRNQDRAFEKGVRFLMSRETIQKPASVKTAQPVINIQIDVLNKM